MTPHYLTFSNIIIDDIVLGDGRTFMGTLGGAGTHALIGMRIWSDRLGYVATVGPDFAPAQRAQLEKLGIDLRGVVVHQAYRTARAWQLFEPDERRIEVMRTDLNDFFKFTPQFEDMPADYLQARGVHVQWGHTFAELNGLLDQLRQANPAVVIAWEPASEHLKAGQAEFGPLLRRLDLLSPDLEQAQAMTGQADPAAMARTLLAWGAPVVALRMGARGSIVAAGQGETWHIPAVPPAALVDVTGAGNAYCGGFLVGLGEKLGPFEAALRAAVSASFAIQQFGVPDIGAGALAEAERRLAWARHHVEAVR
jgi:sugar/nucleoside kinase (ribokinase family)